MNNYLDYLNDLHKTVLDRNKALNLSKLKSGIQTELNFKLYFLEQFLKTSLEEIKEMTTANYSEQYVEKFITEHSKKVDDYVDTAYRELVIYLDKMST